MPTDAVSRTANVERNGGQKWVKYGSSRLQLSAVTAMEFNHSRFFYKILTEKKIKKPSPKALKPISSYRRYLDRLKIQIYMYNKHIALIACIFCYIF